MENIIRAGITTVDLSLGVGAPSAAGSFEDGLAAYGRGDYATAIQLRLPLADQGKVYAQAFLGLMYAEGQGVPQDYAVAVAWFRKAADQGDARAHGNLGLMYLNDLGASQDYAAALNWSRIGVDQGDATGQSSLGFMYLHGQGVAQDYVLVWFTLAAAAGNKDAPRHRAFVAARMPPAQTAEAQRSAREQNFLAVVPDP